MAGRIRPAHLRAREAAEQEAINTGALWDEPKVLEFWTDASVKDPVGEKWAGIGYVTQSPVTDRWYGAAEAFGRGIDPLAAEITAVPRAMDLVLTLMRLSATTPDIFDTVRINSDCSHAIDAIESYRMTNGTGSEFGRLFIEKLRPIEAAGLRFELVQCAGHQNRGLPNDRADSLAKEGSSAARHHGGGHNCDCVGQNADPCDWFRNYNDLTGISRTAS